MNRTVKTIIAIAIGLVIGTILLSVLIPQKTLTNPKVVEVIPDSELVKCIEDKFMNAEFEWDNYMGMFTGSERWISKPLVIRVNVHQHYGKDDTTFITVDFEGDDVELTDNEKLRIAEIIEANEQLVEQKEREKEAKIQKELRERIKKGCK